MAENARTSKMAEFGKKFIRFFKDIRTELKKVIWPTRSQLINNTLSVLAICLVIGAIIWISDGLLGLVVELALK